MAKIETLSVWKDGANYQADELSVRIVNDDLETIATFYYSISQSPVEATDAEGKTTIVTPGATLAEGNVTISGEDYDVWGDASNVNLAAYEYVASKLGLILV
jgi:hypothetical protein